MGILWDVAAAEPAMRLGPGAHKWAVSSVAARPAASEGSSNSSAADAAALFTASLDGTIAEWDFPPPSGSPPSAAAAAAPSRILKGHEGPVQACLVLPGSRALVSASGDRSVRVWLPSSPSAPDPEGGPSASPRVAPSATLRDAHDDTVRGLALLPLSGGEGEGFLLVSVGHDALVKLWALPPALLSPLPPPSTSSGSAPDLTPTLAATLVGHTALVYAAAAAVQGSAAGGGEGAPSPPPPPLLATASEDGTARVWQGSECVSVLRHPGCVWACAWLPDGDLATACADGVVRLWTRGGSGREAPEEERQALAAALAAREEEKAAAAAGGAGGGAGSGSAAPAALPAGLKLSDPSILSQPGRPGQNAVVRDPATGAAAVFEFDGSKNEWTKIGDVVAADGGDTLATGTSKWHLGKQWDHVFDVDVADGQLPLKLPYNDGENPYTAADRFLENEGLPQAYRQKVVEHIISCTGGGAASAAADTSVNVDPFTGGGAYVPGTALAPWGGFAGAGSSSTAASGLGAGSSVTGGGADPFTGTAAAASSAAAAAAAAPAAAARAYVLFDAPPRAEAVAAKARELASAAATTPPLISETDDLDALVAAAISSASASPSAAPLPASSLALLDRMLSTWPASALFPVLDLARLVALSEQGSAALAAAAAAAAASSSAPSSGDGSSSEGGLSRALAAALAADSPTPAKVTAARCVANAVRHPQLRALVTLRAAELAELLTPVAAAAVSGAGAAATAAASSAAALHNLCLSVAVSSSSSSSSAASADNAAPAALLSAVSGILLAAADPSSLDDAVGGFAAGGAASLAASSPANAALAVDLGLREAAASLLLDSPVATGASKPRLSEAAGELARVLASSS